MKHVRLERYLRDATRGLSPKKRVSVMQELRGNLEQHVLDRMVADITETRALEETLNDFGAPQLVSKGMWGFIRSRVGQKRWWVWVWSRP